MFLKSELYSEYKLLKTLSTSAGSFFETCMQEAAKNRSDSCIRTSYSAVGRPRSQRRKQSLPTARGSLQLELVSSRRRRSARYTSGRRPTSGALVAEQQEQSSSQLFKVMSKVELLKSKTGMEMFRKFLNGKLGETNMGLWIDVESLKNTEKEKEFIRYSCNLIIAIIYCNYNNYYILC